MRATHRRRPLKRDRLESGGEIDLALLADLVSYEPSAEHKDYLTPAGLPQLRTDATRCPRHLALRDVTEWLRAALRRGDVSAYFENQFPRYVWATVDGTCYEARLSNSVQGIYKGYPLASSECPTWLS
jgi:hypothetical protein